MFDGVLVASGLKLHDWMHGGKNATASLHILAQYLTNLGVTQILDVGCGNGELLRLLFEMGLSPADLYGCDIEPGHAELARRLTRLPNIVTCEYGWDRVFAGVKFQAITAIAWLHNDWTDKHAIDCRKSLEPDARYLERVLDAVERDLLPYGYFCFDWHSKDDPELQRWLNLLGRCWQEVEVFDEKVRYPFYVYCRERSGS